MVEFLNIFKKVHIAPLQVKEEKRVDHSVYVSRDLSWIKFNYRVLDQAKKVNRSVADKIKFLVITNSNLDEFLMIRIGSLYNYLDYNRDRIDYSGLTAEPFRKKVLSDLQEFVGYQYKFYQQIILPELQKIGFKVIGIYDLKEEERVEVQQYFVKTIYPMLTPMVYDNTHTFPSLTNKLLAFAVVTSNNDLKDSKRISFVQVPQNLPRFYEIPCGEETFMLPIEEIIRWQMQKLFKNIEIVSINLIRITRNGDFNPEESDDFDVNYIEEFKKKINARKTGRVVRLEVEPNYSLWMVKVLKEKFEIDDYNIFETDKLLDLSGLSQLLKIPELKCLLSKSHKPVKPLSYDNPANDSLFEYLKLKDLLLHHPYNNMEPVLTLLESAAIDPAVLAIKITIYRIAKDSRITNALLKAANNGKNVSVLFEVKARFDEENNLKEAERLQKAGCFVVYGLDKYKTHTKLMLIVRQEEDARITRYVHISSGNYNEVTSNFYTDLGILSTNENLANDVSEFFNVITGHSKPDGYQYLITAPHYMRLTLLSLINQEIDNKKKGFEAGIVWKINSLQDNLIIDELYKASQAGVKIKLIVRGICCLRPGRIGLSENIEVVSIVGEFLEHARIFYFHQKGKPLLYSGSADVMVRSFDRRIESLYQIVDENLKRETVNILKFNLKDNVNAYIMKEDGSYEPKHVASKADEFDIHSAFFSVTMADVDQDCALFDFHKTEEIEIINQQEVL